MADNVLGTLFQNIADAIRSKTGDTGKMVPNDFPNEILSIEVGGGGGGGTSSVKVQYGWAEQFTSGNGIVVAHELGVQPDFVFVARGTSDSANGTLVAAYGYSTKFADAFGTSSGLILGVGTSGNLFTFPHSQVDKAGGVIVNANATNFTLQNLTYIGTIAGAEYFYLVIGGLA